MCRLASRESFFNIGTVYLFIYVLYVLDYAPLNESDLDHIHTILYLLWLCYFDFGGICDTFIHISHGSDTYPGTIVILKNNGTKMQNINTANDITCDALHVHLYEHKKESDAA